MKRRFLVVLAGVLAACACLAPGALGQSEADRPRGLDDRVSTAWLVLAGSEDRAEDESAAAPAEQHAARRTAQSRWAETVTACLRAQGWPGAQAGPQDPLEAGAETAAQHAALQEDRAACERVAGPRPGTRP
ncbi:hypothetical protein [Isoptericola haloaureus]|uniref:Secreted protein n=1 Tax=Isoptericola haloaureus TaxID=1542902 RepID=A0ABU7ZBL9_9MICO